eukprot:TRINITY_DN6810_c0_g1_i2.p1 TRINITY_DN6810_c0_g1~~TRINITY_DN6810_c0_g1_i2.p1  ORF type:complete len:871 (-),score=233.86 TRINITY_DN6810_c0_g1_i2:428-2878(-)
MGVAGYCGAAVGAVGFLACAGSDSAVAPQSAAFLQARAFPSSLSAPGSKPLTANAATSQELPSDGSFAGVASAGAAALGAAAAVACKKARSGRRQARVPAAASGSEMKEMVSRGFFPDKPTPLLDSLNNEGTAGMRSMSTEQLKDLAEEVRWQVLDAVSVSGGHLGAGLGVVELTVALHAVFDTPRDEICWDVAHQCQPHKVLTGRRDRIYTLRQGGGLSGFAKRAESEYDAFGAGHSGTSISAAVGFQEAKTKQGLPGHSVAVIGDGAITGGMAWEAMNHAGGLKSKVVVVLNDNGQVSLPTNYNNVNTAVGALSQTLADTNVQSDGIRIQGDFAKLETSDAFQTGRQFLKSATKSLLPGQLSAAAAKVDEYARDFVKTVPFKGSGAGGKGELFEQLGFYYVGPIDGHDMDTLVEVLRNIKTQHETNQIEKPVFLHIKTQKGKGYAPAQAARDKLHAVKPKFNLPKPAAPAKKAEPAKKAPEPLTKIMADQLVREAERDEKIVAITAAMPGGTGISIFEKRFGPARTFDVGIAEQHAVTMAASMAAGGLKPFCAIYSTFLQRGYDQVVHDVALQNLPVRFILDRAGLVGADGPTHGGTFDLSYLACIPNMKICAPADEVELVHMVHTIAKIDDCPTALRFPRGNAYGDMEMPAQPEFLEPGKGRIVREGSGGTLAILSVGSRLRECLKAADRLKSYGIDATVADARWIKPLDTELVQKLAGEHRAMITIEENAIGGFAAQVQQELLDAGFLDGIDKEPIALRSMMFPDRWIDHHEDQNVQYDDAELNAVHIVEKAMNVLARVGVKMEAKVQESLN